METKTKNFDLIKEIKTKTYLADYGYFVEITITCCHYEAYIYHKDHGIKMLMFGVPKKQQSYEEFINLVDKNFLGYKKLFEEEIICEENQN